MTDVQEGQRLLVTMPGSVLYVTDEGFAFHGDGPHGGVHMFVDFDELNGDVIAQPIEEPVKQFGPGSLIRSTVYPEFLYAVTTEGYVYIPTGRYYPGTASHEFFHSGDYELVTV